jgi:predicted GNAT family N-acyltransferase
MREGAMIFREIVFDSADYARERALRNEVLRIPLGLSLADEAPEEERGQWHFGLFNPCGELLACAVAVPLPDETARVRQVAVSPAAQGRGVGRALMENLEVELLRRGMRRIELHARVAVEGFYKRLGYARVGEVFVEISIPHVTMEKRLPALGGGRTDQAMGRR